MAAFLARPCSNFLRCSYSLHGRFDDVVDRWIKHVGGWSTVDGVLVVRYEQLLQEPGEVTRRVAAYLGLRTQPSVRPVTMEQFHSVLPRRGVSGDHRRWLKLQDARRITARVEAAGLAWTLTHDGSSQGEEAGDAEVRA
jgi:hypothetical protein